MGKVILKIIGWIILFPVLFFIIFLISSKIFFNIDTYQKLKVNEQVSQWFPVAVLSENREESNGYSIEIVFYGELDDYLLELKKHGHIYSFNIPKDLENELNEQVLQLCRNGQHYPSQLNPDCAYKTFEIIESKEGKQFIKATYETSYDYINRSWYEAMDKDIIPQYHQHFFGPGIMIDSFMQSVVITTTTYLLLLISYFGFKFYKKRQGRI